MKVEQALRLLPDLEALVPLRGLLLGAIAFPCIWILIELSDHGKLPA